MKIVRLALMLLLVCTFSFVGFYEVLAGDKSCAQDWAFSFTLDLRPDFWSIGSHNYTLEVTDEYGTYPPFEIDFDVTGDASLYDRQVFLRWYGLVAPQWTSITEINPSQDTVFQVTWVFPTDWTRIEAGEFKTGTATRVKWDGGEWVDIPAGPIVNTCSGGLNPSLFQRSWGPKY